MKIIQKEFWPDMFSNTDEALRDWERIKNSRIRPRILRIHHVTGGRVRTISIPKGEKSGFFEAL